MHRLRRSSTASLFLSLGLIVVVAMGRPHEASATFRASAVDSPARIGIVPVAGLVDLLRDMPAQPAEPMPKAAAGCGGDAQTIGREAANPLLAFVVEAACRRDAIGDKAARAGHEFLLVEARLINRNADKAMSAPPASTLLRLQLPGGATLDPDPASDALLSAGFTARPLQPLDRRKFVLAFEVPEEGADQAVLVHAGASGMLFIPLSTLPEVAATKLAGPAAFAGLNVSVAVAERAASWQGRSAPDKRVFLIVDLVLEARSTPVELAPAEVVQLIESAEQSYVPERSAGDEQPATVFPGLPVVARLAFLIPDGATDLSLRLEATSGSVSLPFASTGIAARGNAEPPVAPVEIPKAANVAKDSGAELRLVNEATTWVPIVLRYAGLPGKPGDWLSIARRGSRDDQYVDYIYTDSQGEGEARFPPQPAGEYEARVYFDWPAGGYMVRVRLPFTVVAPPPRAAGQILALGRAGPTEADVITALWRNMPGQPRDTIVLARKGAPDTEMQQSVYLEGRSSGRAVLNPVMPGDYELRALVSAGGDVWEVVDRLSFVVKPADSAGAVRPPATWNRPDHLSALRNVALADEGAFAEPGDFGRAMLDGNAVDYDQRRGYGGPPMGTFQRIWLARPSPIEHVRFLLLDADQRRYRYSLDASADGVAWRTVADQSVVGSQGWQEVPLDGTPLIAFRLNASAAEGGEAASLPIVEFEAYTREPAPARQPLALPGPEADTPERADAAPAEPINVASPALGAMASGGWADPLIDGFLEPSDRSAEAPIGEPFLLTLAQAVAIDDVRLHLPEGPNQRYRYSLELSPDGTAWEELPGYGARDEAGVRSIPLNGRRLKAIRLSGKAATDGGPFRAIELEAFSRDPLPVDALAIPLAQPPDMVEANLALADLGGRVAGVSSSLADRPEVSPRNLIDGRVGTVWTSNDPKRQDLVIELAGDRAAMVGAVDLYQSSVWDWPRVVEVAVVSGENDAAWRTVGRYGVWRAAAQRLEFAPVHARALRLSILSAYDGGQPSLAEIAIREAVSDWGESALPHRRPAFDWGYDLAHPAFGGTVVSVEPAGDDPSVPPTRLIDIPAEQVPADWNYHAPEGDPRTPVITLALPGKEPPLIGALRLSPNAGRSNFSGIGRWPILVDAWVSEESAISGYRWLGRFRLSGEDRLQTFAFAPTRARFVRLLLLRSLNGEFGVGLGGVEVLEAGGPGVVSVLDRDRPNLLDQRLGGHLVVPRGDRRAELIDGTSTTAGWYEDAASLPVALTFGFFHDERRVIDAVGFNPKTAEDAKSWARRVKVLVSDHPVRDFRQIGEFALAPEDRLQVFPVAATSARYLQVRILENNGAPRVSLGEVVAYEAIDPRRPPLAARVVRNAQVYATSANAGGTGTNQAATAAEADREPNDKQAQASPLALGEPASGRIAPLSDVDWYAIDTTRGATDTLAVTVQEQPSLRVGLELYDANGARLAEAKLQDRGTPAATLSYVLPRGRYFARLSRAPNALVVIGDRSGSVDAVRGDIARLAQLLASQIGKDEVASFATMDGTVLNDFSNDAAVLTEAAAALAQGRGGSGVYDSLSNAIDRLEKWPGAKAIVIITDGEDSGSSFDPLYRLWDKLARTGVRIYAVGFGEMSVRLLDGKLGSTGGDMLRAFSVATGGRYFATPSGQAIRDVFPQIVADLRSESAYSILAGVAGEGQLALIETGEKITGVSAPRQIELILDASGSMKAKMEGKKTRMDIARQVLHGVIDRLPPSTEVALRIYGHRYPSKPHEQSCTDTELVVPFAPLDRKRLHAAVDAIKPRGETPIGRSLSALTADFGDRPGGKVVIVVTDGEESCDPKPGDANYPPAVVDRLIGSGADLRVNVVGFGISDSETRRFLSDLAARGGGVYYDADGAQALSAAIEDAFRAGFVVTDAAGRVVVEGKIGDAPVTLPAGTWQVGLTTLPALSLGEVEIRPNQLARLALAKEGDRFGQSVDFGPLVETDAPPPKLGVADREAMRRGLEAYRRGESTAFELLRPFADAGEAEAQAAVAGLLYHGNGVAMDRAASARYATAAARAGNAEAQQYLARLYYLGEGDLAKDPSQAFEWARRSAEAGNDYGQALLGQFYWEGAGVAKDAAQAARWWRKSAAQNNAQAILRLGRLYELGEGVRRDPATAYTLYRRAEALDTPKAKEAADKLARVLKPSARKAADDRAKQGWLPPVD